MLQVRMHRLPRRFPIDTLRFLATSTRHHTLFPLLFIPFFFSFAFSFSFPFSQWNQTCRLLFEEIHNLYLFAISIWHRLHTFFRLVSPFFLRSVYERDAIVSRYSKRRVTSISLGYRYGSLAGLFTRLFSSKLQKQKFYTSVIFFHRLFSFRANQLQFLVDIWIIPCSFFSLTSIKYSLAAVCFLNRTQRNVLLRSNRKLSKRYKHRSQITRRVKSRVAIFPKL